MRNIIFIAPPAAGKGTMSKMLVDKCGYIHISTGDLLREAKNSTDELGTKISNLLSTGKLVPDEIVLELLDNRIKKDDCQNGFILDGYPRNIKQVDSLLKLFNELNIKDYIAIYLDVDYLEAINRTLGRLVCPKCGTSYNKYKEKTKPKVTGICDKCQTSLIERSDDTEETFKIRYQTYIEETKPVIDYFQSIGKLKTVKSIDDIDVMLEQIIKLLEA